MLTRQKIISESVVALLSSLFLYTSLSKLLDYPSFVAGLRAQPLAGWIKDLLMYVLPSAEMLVSVALIFQQWRKQALLMFSAMMLSFTIYTGLIVFNFFKNTPCHCGGILKTLSWDAHFALNTFMLGLALWAYKTSLKSIIYNQEVS